MTRPAATERSRLNPYGEAPALSATRPAVPAARDAQGPDWVQRALFPDVALIFEGGAMRNAYTAAVVVRLLEQGIALPKAYGISAGASHAVDYAARDATRARVTFTEAVRDKRTGGLGSFLRGQGFFNTQYLFEGTAELSALERGGWHFDFDTFSQSSTDVHLEAFGRDDGATQAWTRADMPRMTDVMVRVAASCSYPLFTPATQVDGRFYVDGGMGTSHGICLDAAAADGFQRFFVVRTQPRGHRMPPLSLAKRAAYRAVYARYPHVYRALCERPAAYNALLDRLDGLERQGVVYQFCPDSMPITYKTLAYGKLLEAYRLGWAQTARELPAWIRWLEG